MFQVFLMKFTKWIVVPLALILIGIILSVVYFFNTSTGRNVLNVNQLTTSFQNKGGVISGKFTAQENYLGMITIRFDNKSPQSGDSIFRIKNVLDDNWYHIATISASQYSEIPQYMFGIPPIVKSKNQTYQFEIRLNKPGAHLTLSKEYPVFISLYQFPESILHENKKLLVEFVFKKLSYYVFDKASQGVWIVYGIPFILYLLYQIFARKILSLKLLLGIKKIIFFILNPYIFLILLFAGINIFLIGNYSDKPINIFILLWIICVITYKLESSYSFGVALVLLAFCPFLLSAHMELVLGKSAVWAYMMIIVGIIHSVLETSPIFQKVFKTKLVQLLAELLRFIILMFDRFLINLLRFFQQALIFFVTKIFKEIPHTFFDWTIFIGNFFLLIIGLLIIFITVLFMIQEIYSAIQITNHQRIRLSINPIIKTIEPQLFYKGTNVIIYGEKFGWDVTKSRAIIDGEQINPVLWQDSKIIFLVPLHWKNGTHRIWIEKQVNWDGKKQIFKSQYFEIKILPITENFTDNDRLYFEQLKNLRKETLELNGYK